MAPYLLAGLFAGWLFAAVWGILAPTRGPYSLRLLHWVLLLIGLGSLVAFGTTHSQLQREKREAAEQIWAGAVERGYARKLEHPDGPRFEWVDAPALRMQLLNADGEVVEEKILSGGPSTSVRCPHCGEFTTPASPIDGSIYCYNKKCPAYQKPFFPTPTKPESSTKEFP